MTRQAVLFLAAVFCACGGRLRAAREPFADFERIHPAVILDIRYATEKNFTNQAVYPMAKCALRREVALRLAEAARDLETQGYRLKVFDCYRPLSVQKLFWRLVPDERYVADPKKGSRHNRGAAVDATLTDREGVEVEMPSAYDDFSERAHRDWPHATPAAKKHREILDAAMFAHGFAGLATEWWHFDAFGWKNYPIEDVPFEKIR